MRVPSRVRFFDERTKQAYYSLEKGDSQERRLFKWLTRAFRDLEGSAFCGVQVQKKQIPRQYLKKYRIDNLWKYDLPGAWRLLYSVRANEVIVISIVLEWLPHRRYERKFGY